MAVLVAAMGWPRLARSQTITIDTSTHYQTMRGWEATAYAVQEAPDYALFRNALLDGVVEAGIDRVRLPIRSGAENRTDYWDLFKGGMISAAQWRGCRYATVNDNGDPNVINPAGFHFSELDDTIRRVVLPLEQRVEANGEHLYINLNYVAFTRQIGHRGFCAGATYVHADPREYAEFMLAAFQHMKSKFGWVPDAIEVILEPDNVPQWNGTTIGQAIVATAARLSAAGFHPEFIAPSNTDMGKAVTYYDALARVPGAAKHLGELSYHRYRGVSKANLQALASRAARDGIGAAMLEWWSPRNGYETLLQDLTTGRNSAWQQGTLGGRPNGRSSLYVVDDSTRGHPRVTIRGMTKFTRQYTKFVRFGAIRVGASSDDGNFRPVAFVNRNGSEVVVVAARAGGSFSVRGLSAGTYGIKYTTAGEYDVDRPNQTIPSGKELSTSIPAQGVITVYGTGSGRSGAGRGTGGS